MKERRGSRWWRDVEKIAFDLSPQQSPVGIVGIPRDEVARPAIRRSQEFSRDPLIVDTC
jgi:hypothetical protein